MQDSPEQAALALFRHVAATVPAYAAFLAEQGIDPARVTGLAEVPLTTKANYVRRHPLPSRCRDGVIGDMLAVSSGSTGEPTFWPRSPADEAAVATRFDQVFSAFESNERATLAVVCFALGTWVGGLYTTACLRHLAARGHRITVVAPGSDKREILRVLPELGPHFDQVVLLGYPPFLKDVIDTGRAQGVPWADYDLKLVTAGEVFSEEWRSLIAERTGMRDPARSTASLYGTADAGVLGNETPLSIEIRRSLSPEVARELFGESRLPTLLQYDPYLRFFEEQDGTLLFTGDNGAPLIRYHIADEGGLIPYEEMLAFLDRHGLSPKTDGPQLPFVYVFGRSHFTVSFYGANVYPENITVGLEQPPVSPHVTGKFVLEARETEDRDRALTVTVELAPAADPPADFADTVADSILEHLLRLNSEYAHYVPEGRRRPVVRLRPLGDAEYFPPGVKHRYTRPPDRSLP
ncbi:phenylacetate--CoA ligase family protein [Actinomadura barringtoniae]|uniref:Phenylacetate--CoA ligase family protein n=1 Tax=Actinomadura barringtoniae TaxID=1427535 RepID=A0A939PHH8_9ACTN|nr:phenylacetate--CoA ligase family protein [Actinomadura barringtoniae]MBO2452357.1 phenylacetate--CoA ligase family protein [Actinomadura barringtoniae]